MKIISRHQTLFFFLMIIGITWVIWIPAAIAKLNGSDSLLAPSSLGSLARWTPGLVAVFLTAILAGKVGVKALFRPLRYWRVNIVWYVFALFFGIGLFLAAKGLDTLLGNSHQISTSLFELYGAQAMMMLPVVMLLAVPGALAEEVGWRGFALPRLQSHSGAFIASLMIGLVWGIWHIPLLVYYGLQPAEIALSVVGTIPIAILYTWLYNQTRGSLLLVFLFHFGQQVSQTLLGSWPGYTDEILMWAIALLLIVLPGTANLARSHQLAEQA